MRRACAILLAFAAFMAGSSALAQTQWGYAPTNAFPSLVFSNPVCLASPPGETNRLFVVEKHGRIIVITNLAAPTRTIFMDINGRISVDNTNEAADEFNEPGLLSIAFHPGYATNRLFYVFYTGQDTNGSGTPQLHDILSRFETSAADANVADTNSEIRFLSQYDRSSSHNAGDLHFGADGYLYVSLGDEGGDGDFYGNSQHIDRNFFSAIMRLDVDKKTGNLAPNPHVSLPSLTNYFVPADNPWVGATNFNGLTVNSNNVRTEFWAVGMRNPWRFSFDPATGELYLGHVGQKAIEWVDIVTNGANCGWNYFEGDHKYSGISPPAGFVYEHPLVEYSHTQGRAAVIGGIVSHGARVPDLNGVYLYADENSSEFWALRRSPTNVIQNTVIFTDTNAHPACFGIDPSNGDPLYVALRAATNAIIRRIVATNSVPVFTAVQISGTNLIVSGSNGPHSGNYWVLATTNVTSTNWVRVATNPFGSSGSFNFTNRINVAATNRQFYMLQLP